jgi:hypothetical protein
MAPVRFERVAFNWPGTAAPQVCLLLLTISFGYAGQIGSGVIAKA